LYNKAEKREDYEESIALKVDEKGRRFSIRIRDRKIIQ